MKSFLCLLFSLFWGKVSCKTNSFCRCESYAFDSKPFVAVWNSPTIGCDFNYSIPIHLLKYGIYENDHQTWNGNKVTVFSSAQLGLYPYYILNGDKNYNGGLPQLVDLNQHLRKARIDIINKIPDVNFNGLAVIDWEPWRPIWETNWATKRIYKVRSVELVRSKHPHWTLSRLIEKAKTEFEEAARAFFEHTITLGKQLRPKALWGFYGFPDCFAHEENRYQCSPEVQKHNNRLDWLFSASTALFPSMYLLDEHPDNRDYVLGRMRETLRFASKGTAKNRHHIPVFVYHRNIYENNPYAFNFLTKADLENTIGVAADLGASGVIVWGNRFDENTSPEVCHKIDTYVSTKLAPFLQMKQRQVESCNDARCNHRGHCVKKSLLNAELLKLYESEEMKESCSSPITSVHMKKKSEVEYSQSHIDDTLNTSLQPMANTPLNASIIANVTYTPNNRTKDVSSSGYNIDLGVMRPLDNHSAVDEFFEQVNVTSGQNSTRRASVSHFQSKHGNSTRNIKKDAIKTIAPDYHEEQKRPSKNPLQEKKIKEEILKKSKIPHVENLKMEQMMNYSHLSNEKKSKLVHQLLAAVTGNLISTHDVKLKHNASIKEGKVVKRKKIQSARKSEISRPLNDSPSMLAAKKTKSWLPHMYVILIGVSLGGALVFSLVFVAVYYYVSLRNTFPSHKHDPEIFPRDEKANSSNPPKAHSSPKGSEVFHAKEKSEKSKLEDSERRKGRSLDRQEEGATEGMLKYSEKDSDKRLRRVRSVDRRIDVEEERSRHRYKERYTQEYIDEQMKRSRSKDRAKSYDSIHRHQDDSRESRRNISRDRKKSGIPELKRSRSRREKLKREHKPEEENSEIEININDIR